MFQKQCILIVSILALCVASNDDCPEQCISNFKCSPYYTGDMIWAFANGVCRNFVNGCIRKSVDCQRQNQCLPATVLTTKSVCKQKCADYCNAVPQIPVCALFPIISPPGSTELESFEFPSRCELNRWSCRNSRPYVSVDKGVCPETSS